MQLLLHIKVAKIRHEFVQGIQINKISSILPTIQHLNKLKRGLADMEIDCDQALKALQDINTEEKLQALNDLQIGALLY